MSISHALIEKGGGTIMGHCQESSRCKKCPRQAREVEKWKIVQQIRRVICSLDYRVMEVEVGIWETDVGVIQVNSWL